jgi:riboflavin synthase
LFTGIVSEIGRVESLTRRGGTVAFKIRAHDLVKEIGIGDSVAVNGVCQTVTDIGERAFSFDSVVETLRTTNLSSLNRGASVNLEAALRLGDRISGHLVSGHVDSTGIVRSRRPTGYGNVDYTIQVPGRLKIFIHEKGSVCLDGVSLTVKAISGPRVEVTVIPHTLKGTIIGNWRVGTSVNIEVDQIARYLTLGVRTGGGKT